MGNYLVASWLAVGLAIAVLQWRLAIVEPRPVHERVTVSLLAIATAAGVASALMPQPWSAVFVWLTLACVNAALASVGWSIRFLSLLGLGATAVAVVLITVRSFSSLPVMFAAGVLCLGAALLAGASATRRIGPRNDIGHSALQ